MKALNLIFLKVPKTLLKENKIKILSIEIMENKKNFT